jgi:A/G-specific adenine glycosylase
MDLGASLCAPKNPDCAACPLKADCAAYALGIQEQRPVRAPKAELPQREYAAIVLRRKDEVLIRQRPAGGLLGGLWEFPNLEISNPRRAKAHLRRGMGLGVEVGKRLHVFEHSYSHFRARLTVYAGRGEWEGNWVPISSLAGYPMGKLDRRIADSLTHAVG